MKRIYNSVPLQSVLYTVGGLQKIRIIDHDDDAYCTDAGHVVFEGLEKDFRWCISGYYKAAYATLRGIDIDEDTICFSISTKYEQY